MLEKLQKRTFRTAAPSLAASLEPVDNHQNVASPSLFFRYFFGRSSSELAGWLVFLIFVGGPLVILMGYIINKSPVLGIIRMSLVSFFTKPGS